MRTNLQYYKTSVKHKYFHVCNEAAPHPTQDCIFSTDVLTDHNVVVGVAADDLLDLLSGSLSGGEGAVGVTVGVVQVQDVYGGVCPQTRLTQHGGSVSEITWN